MGICHICEQFWAFKDWAKCNGQRQCQAFKKICGRCDVCDVVIINAFNYQCDTCVIELSLSLELYYLHFTSNLRPCNIMPSPVVFALLSGKVQPHLSTASSSRWRGKALLVRRIRSFRWLDNIKESQIIELMIILERTKSTRKLNYLLLKSKQNLRWLEKI